MDYFARIAHPIHGPSSFLDLVDAKLGTAASAQVAPLLSTALGSGINWMQLLMTLLPIILSLFTGGGGGSLAAIIQAILSLLNPTPLPSLPASGGK